MSEINEATLSEYDFIALLDASGSMSTEDMAGGRSRWKYMQESVEAFVRDLSKYDSDGIDIVLFGGSVQSFQGVAPDKVKEVFATRSPRGSTPLAEALTEGLKLAGKSDKKDFLIVFTDGVPDDKVAAANVIRKQANSQQNDDDCTILFVQVGRDAEATRYLTSLDDDLTGCKFDIVDAVTMEQAEAFPTTAALVLKAIAD
jgi:Mg-chelatase subunit ChlD